MIKNIPHVSIIIPTYNGERFLNRTVESVLAQTYTDWELIIVDDFSSDSTRDVIKKWEMSNEKIHSIFLDKNSGAPAHPKNVGIEIAKGEFIAYLDQDDIWLPEKLNKQVSILENNLHVGFVSCEALIINDSEQVVGRETIPNIPENGELFPSLFDTNFMFSNSSLLIRRIVINHCGPRDEDPAIGNAEDREYELRVASAGQHFYVIHESLFLYRLHKKNASKKKNNFSSYLSADYKYVDLYRKYNWQWRLLKNTGYIYLRYGDTKNARKYLNLLFSEKSPTVGERVVYVLSHLGNLGSKIFVFIINILDNLRRSNYLYKLKRFIYGSKNRCDKLI